MKTTAELTADDIREAIAKWCGQINGSSFTAAEVELHVNGAPAPKGITATVRKETRR